VWGLQFCTPHTRKQCYQAIAHSRGLRVCTLHTHKQYYHAFAHKNFALRTRTNNSIALRTSNVIRRLLVSRRPTHTKILRTLRKSLNTFPSVYKHRALLLKNHSVVGSASSNMNNSTSSNMQKVLPTTPIGPVALPSSTLNSRTKTMQPLTTKLGSII